MNYAQHITSESQLPPSFESMEKVAGSRGMYEEKDFTKYGNLLVKRGVSVGNIDEYYYFYIKDRERPIVVHLKDGGKRDKIFEHTDVSVDGFNASEESKKLRPLVEWVRKNDPGLLDRATDPENAVKLSLMK